ncbi:adenylate/guanylate cyclase domain-containing protein [Ruegeria profundi]|uniref:adenylate/guanylate cyclase domain-containing protein n=1 Tax=Ruegeria profundi TaxID=1685378 RepID=UPI001CD420EA|nr:adenylate/guanylate cyclase domain-containing protein [Ruegeria profundi]MCA0927609.1 cyclic nucleotide-binding domain-containing protein [Ruegeria profundi]
MAAKSSITRIKKLNSDHEEALFLCGLVDDVKEPLALEPRPYRYAEGENICQPGDPAECLWIIVTGSVAVRLNHQTLFVRRRNEVIGEQHLAGNGYRRVYELVADESNVEVLIIDKSKIEEHPEAGVIWRNIAKIISIKLRNATRKTASLGRQLADDTRILHAYTNQYALSRRMQSGSAHQADYVVERAVIWFSDVVNFSRFTLKTAPERVADVVQRFFNAQTTPVLDAGGHIDKFIGDGLMAFWVMKDKSNSATAICAEALNAAEQAARNVEKIRIGNEPLSLRIGLHLGLVVSGDFGSATRHQFTMIGPEVNKAARLEQVHSDDIVNGNGVLGGIRLSREFWDELSEFQRQRFSSQFRVRAKNIGEIDVFTN